MHWETLVELWQTSTGRQHRPCMYTISLCRDSLTHLWLTLQTYKKSSVLGGREGALFCGKCLENSTTLLLSYPLQTLPVSLPENSSSKNQQILPQKHGQYVWNFQKLMFSCIYLNRIIDEELHILAKMRNGKNLSIYEARRKLLCWDVVRAVWSEISAPWRLV